MRGLALAALAVTGAGGFAVTTLPRPPFPGPVASEASPMHMRIVSSRDVGPSPIVREEARVSWAPFTFRGLAQQTVMPQTGRLFVLYGKDGSSLRSMLAFDNKRRFRYGFDFANYVWPPRIAPGEREFVYEEIQTAREGTACSTSRTPTTRTRAPRTAATRTSRPST